MKTIRENPADNLPRLVYADWLEEHDETYYANFIRLQCGSPLPRRTDPNGTPYPTEVQKFFVQRQYVNVMFPRLDGNYILHRGFISEVNCSVNVLRECWELLRCTQPDFLINLDWIRYDTIDYVTALDQFYLGSDNVWNEDYVPTHPDFQKAQRNGRLRQFLSDALTKWLDFYYAEPHKQNGYVSPIAQWISR